MFTLFNKIKDLAKDSINSAANTTYNIIHPLDLIEKTKSFAQKLNQAKNTANSFIGGMSSGFEEGVIRPSTNLLYGETPYKKSFVPKNTAEVLGQTITYPSKYLTLNLKQSGANPLLAGMTGGLVGSKYLLPQIKDLLSNTFEVNNKKPETYNNQFQQQGQTSGQPQTLNYFSDEVIDKVIGAESTNNSKAVSNAGATGLMQIMPETWEEINEIRRNYNLPIHPYSKSTDPKINKEYGTVYLNKRVPQILEKDFPDIPVNQITMILFYGGGKHWLDDYRKDPKNLTGLSKDAKTYLSNIWSE